MQTEPRRSIPCFLPLLALALLPTGGLVAQPRCPCQENRPFGSCLSINLDTKSAYPGNFPGSATVVTSGNSAWLFVADLFTGLTFRYDLVELRLAGTDTPEVLLSPRGSATTTGIAHVQSGTQNRLFWAIGGELYSTGVPAVGATTFNDLVRIGPVDLAGLAERLLGSRNRAGALGGIAYHPGRGRLWAVDIVNDLYFELTLDGNLALDPTGLPIHFFNPARHPLGGGAYGNTITYAASGGQEYFDLPIGSVADGRPERVLRVHAPTDPTAAGRGIGADSGIGYRILPNLAHPSLAPDLFPTAIAFWGNSCALGQSSEYIVAYNFTGGPHVFMEVSADEPSIANVADFSSRPGEANSVEIRWRKTRGYERLEIQRERLTADGVPVETVFTTDFASDPESFRDVTLRIPPDGTFRYRAIATAGTGPTALRATDVIATVTVGRGTPLEALRFTGSSANSPQNPSGPPPTAFAATTTPEHLYVADANTGIAQRYRLSDLQSNGTVQGPFVAGAGRTVGLAFNRLDQRLYWLGRIGTAHFLQSTNREGSSRGALITVTHPATFLRGPLLGDLSHDPGRRQFWTVDLRHNVAYAIGEDGLFKAGSLIQPPLAGGILGGGIAVDTAESDETSVSLDITAGPANVARIDRLVRGRYRLTDLANPEMEYRLDLPHVTGAATPGGIALTTRRIQAKDHRLQVVVGTDTNLIYLLDLELATVGDLPFRRGDANNDGRLNISDPSFILSHLFRSGSAPLCEEAADANASGAIEIADAIALFNYLFRNGPAPSAPFPDCGFGAVDTGLTCETSHCVPTLP
jgi:hypothetical protein